MGVVFRQSVKTTIVIFLGAVLGALITYVYTFTLSKSELGFITNLINQGAILQLLVLMGTGSVIVTYIHKYPVDDIRRKALVTWSVLITIITTLIFTVAYALLKEQVIGKFQIQDRPYLSQFYMWLPVLTLIWSMMTLADLYLMAMSKIAISAFMREVVLRILNFVLLGLFYYQLISFDSFVIGIVLVHIVPAGMLVYISSRTEGFGLTSKLNVFSKAEVKELLHFAWYHLLLIVSLNFLGYVDSLMLAPLDKDGMKSLAAYRVAVLVISIMTIPYRAMSSAAFAILNKVFIENDAKKLKDLFDRISVNMVVVALGMFVLIALNLDNLVAILPKGYEVVKPIVMILMFGRIVDMITGMNNELISISKHYKFSFRLSALIIVIVVVLNRWLIPIYGVFGAAWSITIAFAIFNILKMFYLWKKMRLQPFSKNTLYVCLAAVLAALVGYLIPALNSPIITGNPNVDTVLKSVTDAGVRSIAILVTYLGALIYFKPSADLHQYIQSIKKDKRLF